LSHSLAERDSLRSSRKGVSAGTSKDPKRTEERRLGKRAGGKRKGAGTKERPLSGRLSHVSSFKAGSAR